MSNDSGLRQTPFTEAACPVPDATSGDQGIGGGLDAGPGGSGLSHSPWNNAPVPAPSNLEESGPFGNPSRYSSVDGSTHRGESLAGDITSPPTRTLDKR